MLMAQKYETQEYQVIDQIDNAEIRFYPSAAMIKVSAEQNLSLIHISEPTRPY